MALISDFKDDNGKWVPYIYYETYNRNDTFSGRRWSCMKARCTPGTMFQKANPNYIGCTVSESFKDFQFFTEWHRSQVAYGLNGYDLDKDLLIPGNKFYSEDNCVLIPSSMNISLARTKLDRKTWAQHWQPRLARKEFVVDIKVINTIERWADGNN